MRSGVIRLVVWAGCLSLGVASAGNVSFTGTFTQDDQMEVFRITDPTASFSAETFGYGGGTNAASQVIPAGGFDPYLSLFDGSGNLVATSFNNTGITDPSSGVAWDALLSVSGLNTGGTYTLILTEYNNIPSGSTLSDGFTESGQGNFTASEFPCGAGSFCDEGLDARTGGWALDINNVGSAVDTSGGTAPEPASILLLSAGFAGLSLLRRRGKRV